MRQIDFKKTLTELAEKISMADYKGLDTSDIGNEIGYQLGKILSNMTEDEVNYFITGFKHGVSLTNGTHPRLSNQKVKK
jgi:predicted hydrocarbon binding protein